MVCISGEKPSLKGQHWCQEVRLRAGWPMTRVAPPFQVPTSPVRPCHVLSGFAMSRQVPANVPSGPSKCPVRSQQMSRQVPANVPSGPECPVRSQPKSRQQSSEQFPRSRRKFRQILSGEVPQVSRRRTRGTCSCCLAAVTSQSWSPDPHCPVPFLSLSSLSAAALETRAARKNLKNAQTRSRGGKDSAPCLSVSQSVCPLSVSQCAPCPSVGVSPVRLSVCLLSVCQCAFGLCHRAPVVCQSHCHCDH